MRSRSLSTSVVILWNLLQPALWWTIPAIEAIERSEPTVKRFKAMQVKDGIRRTLLSLLLNSIVKWPTSFIIYGQTPEIGNFPLIARCKICSQRVVVGGGGWWGYWSRFMENVKWPFHISRTINSAFTFQEKQIFIRSVLLILVKNYSQRTALFDVPTILPLLVLGAVKRKPSSLFRSWGSAPSSNTETLSSEGSLSYSESWSALEIQMKIHLFFHHLVALQCHSSRWIQHSKLVSQIILIKNHGSRRLSILLMGNKTSNSRFTKIPFTALFSLDVFISIERVDTYWCWQRTMQPCLLFSRNCTKKAKNLS